MREILFRAIDEGTHEWVYGYYCERPSPFHIGKEYSIFDDKTISRYTIFPETVGQYTGLTDTNGKKIFEGDVVRVCLDSEICVGKVIWDSEIASYNIAFNNGKCVLPLDIFIAKNKVGDKVWIDVIGNIHDNPELLENP